MTEFYDLEKSVNPPFPSMKNRSLADDWLLKRGDEVLGFLQYEETDQPWFYFQFHPEPAFASVCELFEEELRLFNEDRWDEWDETYNQIETFGLTLVSTIDGRELHEFLLHIDGNCAWFRA